MIFTAGLYATIQSRFGEEYLVGKIVRETGSLVFVHFPDRERRVGKSRVVMTGDARSMETAAQQLRSAAGVYAADRLAARRKFEAAKAKITNNPGVPDLTPTR